MGLRADDAVIAAREGSAGGQSIARERLAGEKAGGKSAVYREEDARTRRRYRSLMLAMVLIMAAAVFFSFWVGYFPLTPAQVTGAFAARFGYQGEILPQAVTIFWNIRLPRIFSAMLIGASLSVSGAVYQGMFRNPLVSPDILGVSAGASLGAAVAIHAGLPNLLIQLSAFFGGVGAVAFAYLISRKSAHSRILSLVLTGSMIMALCNAGVTMIKYISDPDDVLQQLTFWLMGSLAKTTGEALSWSAGPMAAGLLLVFILRWRVNLLTLDDDEAKSLGVDTGKYRMIFILFSTLMSAAAVCLGGLIGWVGLMIPHLGRVLAGPDYGRLIPVCAMMGASYLVLMDDLARSVLAMELPLGVVTSVMGAPFFVYLIIRRREG